MGSNYIYQNEISETQQQLDFFLAPLSIPVGKLDADQYSAEDLDGVTESLFGSGNLSFLSMQSGQSNDAMALNDAFAIGADDTIISNRAFSNAFVPASRNIFSTNNDFDGGGTTVLADSGYRSPAESVSDMDTFINDGDLSYTAQGGLNSSNLFSDNIVLNSSNFNMVGNTMGDSYIGGIRSLLSNGGNNGDTFVDNIFQGDVTEVVNSITQNITNVGDVVNQVINHETLSTVTNIVNTVLGDTVTNISNNLTDLLNGDGHIALNLDANLLDTVGAHVGVLIEDSVAGDISVNAVTAHLNDLVQDLTGLHIPLVADLGATVGFDLLNGGAGTDNAAGDTDLLINGLEHLGLDLPEIVLDPVEGLVGDIDITIDLPTDLLNPSTLINGVHGLVESIDDIAVASVPEILDIISPEGLEGALGIEFFDQELTQDLELTVGDIIGQIDPALSDALDLLGGDTSNGLADILGSVWTENGIGDGGLFDDVVHGGNMGDMLPDPIGAIAEGLGALDIPNLTHHAGGGLGGLFG